MNVYLGLSYVKTSYVCQCCRSSWYKEKMDSVVHFTTVTLLYTKKQHSGSLVLTGTNAQGSDFLEQENFIQEISSLTESLKISNSTKVSD